MWNIRIIEKLLAINWPFCCDNCLWRNHHPNLFNSLSRIYRILSTRSNFKMKDTMLHAVNVFVFIHRVNEIKSDNSNAMRDFNSVPHLLLFACVSECVRFQCNGKFKRMLNHFQYLLSNSGAIYKVSVVGVINSGSDNVRTALVLAWMGDRW